jgi:uncharacterized protein
MTGFFRFLLVSLAFTLGTINFSHAASFDCSKATTETEIAICNDPELSALDYRMSLIWGRVNGRLDIQDQKDWLTERDQCGDIYCLKASITERINLLQKIEEVLPEFELRFSCNLDPMSFSIYNKDGAYGEWRAEIKDHYFSEIVDATWDTAGSGSCRIWSYTFSYDELAITIHELSSCSGPDGASVPKEAKGEITFGTNQIRFFCF